jgi:hypothetical protein
MAKGTTKGPGGAKGGKPRAAAPRKPGVRRTKAPAGAVEEIERTEPERAPLPDPTGLAHTLSPVDLPDPPAPLPHGLRWASQVIAVATLVLAVFNAHALRGWSYQLAPNDYSARIVTIAEAWYDLADQAGLNRPFEAMHAAWQSAKDARFAAQVAPPDMAAAGARPAPRVEEAQR